MDRREFLAVTGTGVIAMAPGCLGGDDEIETGRVSVGGTESDETARLESGGVVDVEGGTMRVTATDVQRSIISPLRDNDVYEPEGGQFLMVQVETDSSRWSRPGQFLELEVDGTRLDPESEIPYRVFLNDNRDELAFGVRSMESALGKVLLTHEHQTRWNVPDSLVEQFGTAPEFHLQSATISEFEGETALDLTVENRGERDGVFRCTTASESGNKLPETVLFTVPSGQEVATTITNDAVASWPSDAGFSHSVERDTRAFAIESRE